MCDQGHGVGETGLAVYLDFADAINRLGETTVAAKYGNLFDMYKQITGENPYKTPMKIYPAIHYTMGGLWVDYNLMSNIPGLFIIGEANFSDHGANRLGASALMQGLADGYFIAPNCVGNYLATQTPHSINLDNPIIKEDLNNAKKFFNRMLNVNGELTVDEIHKKLGRLMWDYVGMARNEEGL